MRRTLLSMMLILTGVPLLFANGGVELDSDGWLHFPDLKNFRAVEIRLNAHVTLTQGNDWEVKVRGDSRDLEDLDIYIRGGALVLRRESLFNFMGSPDDLEVAVTFPSIERIVLSSNGTARSTDILEVRNLELSLNGSGEMDIEARADTVDMESSGSGDLDFRGRSDRLLFDSTGSGDSRVEIRTNRSDIRSTGSGRLEIRGQTDLMTIRVTGSGKIRADRYEAKEADIIMTGSGSVEAHVTDRLDARLTGTGNLQYRGNPGSTGFEITGTGRIRQS